MFNYKTYELHATKHYMHGQNKIDTKDVNGISKTRVGEEVKALIADEPDILMITIKRCEK